MRGLFRELVVLKAQRDDTLELASFQAYQTVRIHWMTKAKKGRMPEFRDVVRKRTENTIDEWTSPPKADAMMQLLAARAGTKVQPIDRTRIVRNA